MIRQLYAASMLTLLAAACVGLEWAHQGVQLVLDQMDAGEDEAASEEQVTDE